MKFISCSFSGGGSVAVYYLIYFAPLFCFVLGLCFEMRVLSVRSSFAIISLGERACFFNVIFFLVARAC